MRRRDEGGAVLVVLSMLMVGVVIIAAIVIDLGQLRSDRQKNKRLSDAAAIAAAHDLQSGPWRSVCTAYQYVLANAEGFTSFDSEVWSDQGSTPTTHSSTLGDCPASAPYTTPCSEADSSTWSLFQGAARGGEIEVEIRSGYALPDSRFAEDASIAGDNGNACDQVAVIVRETRAPFFGRAAGIDRQRTSIRTVARITPGELQVAALVVLDRVACRALHVTSNVGGRLVVSANGDTPGSIVVDSDGSQCSGGSKAVEGSPLNAGAGPNIVAERTATSPAKSGRISIFALNTNAGVAHSEACGYGTPAPTTCSMQPVPIRSPLRIGRSILDERYLGGVRALVSAADTTLAGMPGTYTRLTSLDPLPGLRVFGGVGNPRCEIDGHVVIEVSDFYIDCPLTVQATGTLRFTAVGANIVAKSTIGVVGNAAGIGTFAADRTSRIYVGGDPAPNGDPMAIDVSGNFVLNDGGSGACATPTIGNPTAAMVVRSGSFRVDGGFSSLRMCQTTVAMGSGWSASPGPPNAWPTTSGAAPYDNSFKGRVVVAGQGDVEWTAPNAVPHQPATAADWANLEDLTLWTESSQTSSISGQGLVRLAGVFALPNATPFSLSGTGVQAISADAQFWTRRLNLSGQSELRMSPNPDDSIPVIDFTLVR